MLVTYWLYCSGSGRGRTAKRRGTLQRNHAAICTVEEGPIVRHSGSTTTIISSCNTQYYDCIANGGGGKNYVGTVLSLFSTTKCCPISYFWGLTLCVPLGIIPPFLPLISPHYAPTRLVCNQPLGPLFLRLDSAFTAVSYLSQVIIIHPKKSSLAIVT